MPARGTLQVRPATAPCRLSRPVEPASPPPPPPPQEPAPVAAVAAAACTAPEPEAICTEGDPPPPSGNCPGSPERPASPEPGQGPIASRAAPPTRVDVDLTLSDADDGDAERQPVTESTLNEILASCVLKAAPGAGGSGGGARGRRVPAGSGVHQQPRRLLIDVTDVLPGGGAFGCDGVLPVEGRALGALVSNASEFQHDEVIAGVLGDALAERLRAHPGQVPPVFPWSTFDWSQDRTGAWWRDRRMPGLRRGLAFDPFDCESWWFPCNYTKYHWFSALVRLPTAAQRAEILIFDSSPGISTACKADDGMRELLGLMGTGRAGWEPEVVRAWPVDWPAGTPRQSFVDCGVYAAVWGRNAVLDGVLPHVADPPQVWSTAHARRDKQRWLYRQLLNASQRQVGRQA